MTTRLTVTYLVNVGPQEGEDKHDPNLIGDETLPVRDTEEAKSLIASRSLERDGTISKQEWIKDEWVPIPGTIEGVSI